MLPLQCVVCICCGTRGSGNADAAVSFSMVTAYKLMCYYVPLLYCVCVCYYVGGVLCDSPVLPVHPLSVPGGVECDGWGGGHREAWPLAA